MEGIAARFCAEVRDGPGELAPLGAQIAVLNFELANGVLSWNDDRQVDVADIQWLAIKVLSTLVGKRTSNLIIAPAEGILADGSAPGAALRNH